MEYNYFMKMGIECSFLSGYMNFAYWVGPIWLVVFKF